MSTKRNFDWLAFFLLTSIPLWFGMGQEIVAVSSILDDYYFLLRSLSLKMHGSYLAPIREILYPLFIRVSWLYGLGLRNFEVFCYGLSLFFLWGQILNLTRTRSRLIAWLTLVPLSLFCYQHAVFNRATYDALALILLPLSFATSIYLYRKQASWPSSILAGVVASLHVLTRPEGVLFILPPMVSLLFVSLQAPRKANYIHSIKVFFFKGCAIFAVVVLSQQVASAINWRYFGFWAPTIMKSHSFQRCSSALMAINPGEASKIRYATVPKTSLEKACQVSRSFRKAKPYLSRNLDGNGISNAAHPAYRAVDGSISGGHFQWALLQMGEYVAGPRLNTMLEYYDEVADEICAGFERGEIKRRAVYSTALGPNFSLLDSRFWSSLWNIGRFHLNLNRPSLPEIQGRGDNLQVESDFDKIALRRSGLLKSSEWQMAGWVVSPNLGIPDEITLDREASNAGIRLRLNERPDVARVLFGLEPDETSHPICGIAIASYGSCAGNLRVVTKGEVVLLPLEKIKPLKQGREVVCPDIRLYVDAKSDSSGSPTQRVIPITTWVTTVVYYAVRGIIFIALVFLILISFFHKAPVFRSIDLKPVCLMFCLATSVVVPRQILFAAIDANMYPTEIRYLAPGSFAVWMFAGFTFSYLIVSLIKSRKKITA